MTKNLNLNMSLQISDLKTDREWSSATSVKKQQFYNLLPWFSKGYVDIHGISIENIQENLNQEFIFSTCEQLLFFVLFAIKNPTTYDVNGLIFNISQSASEQNFKKGILILKRAIELADQLPAQSFEDQEQLLDLINQHKKLKLDVTEITVQRPKNKADQKSVYSGKKKTHS